MHKPIYVPTEILSRRYINYEWEAQNEFQTMLQGGLIGLTGGILLTQPQLAKVGLAFCVAGLAGLLVLTVLQD